MADERHRTLTVTPELQRELKRGTVRVLVGRPLQLIIPGLTVMVLALMLVGALLPGDPSARLLAHVGIFALVFFGLHFWRWQRVTAMVTRAYPVGSVIHAEVADDGLHLAGPSGSSTIPDQNLRSITRRGSVVVLRTQVQRSTRFIQPGALFEERDLAELQARIAAGSAGRS